MNKKNPLFISFLFLVIFSQTAAQTFQVLKHKVSEFTLNNGMKFIVFERHDAPVVSFHIYADVGAVNESYGITGISHLLEHMAFKGSKIVGTKDFAKEMIMLDKMDELYTKLIKAKTELKPDTNEIKNFEEAFRKVKDDAHEVVIVDEYADMVLKQGGIGLNAYTSSDATQYICKLPSNRLEFWMIMESDRFLNPVFREFFEERDVVMEERRLGLETQPTGKLIEDFMAVAFKAHPYHHEVIGHMSDLKRITRSDVESYFKSYYGPNNLTVAVVGDIDPVNVQKLAKVYFGRLPGSSKPEPLRTVEPEQWGERHVYVEAQAQPMLIAGYHRPDINHKDDLMLDAMANVFGIGRSSRLYSKLVKEKKLAIQVGAFNGWPGNKFPNLFAVYAVPAQGHTAAECLNAIDEEIELFKNNPISAEEVEKYVRYTKKWLINSLKDNSSLARSLTFNEVIRGDWQRTFDLIEEIEKVNAKGIQEMANKYLIKKKRTIGEIIPEKVL